MVLSIVIFAVMVLSTLFAGDPTLAYWGLQFTRYATVVTALSTGLGLLSVCIFHIPKILRFENEPQLDWLYSLSTLFFVFAFIIVGLVYGSASKEYSWWYDTFNAPIASAAPFLSGFFMVPATYKAFKLRNFDAAALMLPAVIFMIYQTPMFSGVPIISHVSLYLLAYVTSACFRACVIIVGLGIVYLSIRTVIGMEKGYLQEV